MSGPTGSRSHWIMVVASIPHPHLRSMPCQPAFRAPWNPPSRRTWVVALCLLAACLTAACGRDRSPDLDVEVATATPTPGPAPVVAETDPTPVPPPRARTPEEALAWGRQLEADGQADAAVRALSGVAQASDPALVWQAAFVQTRLLVQSGQWVAADEALDRFFAAADRLGEPLDDVHLGSAWIQRAIVRGALLDTAGAEDAWRRAVAHLPVMEVWIHRRWGRMLFEVGRPEQGLDHWRMAADLAPTASEQAYILLSMAGRQEARGLHEEAAGIYEEILDFAREPAYRTRIHYMAGQAWFGTGQPEQAFSHWYQATEIQRESWYAWLSLARLIEHEQEFDSYNRGYINHAAGSWEAAVGAFDTYLETAVASDHRLPWALLYAGHSLVELESWVRAASHYRRIVEEFPACDCVGAAWHGLLRVYAAVENADAYAQALVDFRAAQPNDSTLATLDANEGFALLAQGNAAAAGEVLTGFAVDFPEHSRVPEALFALAEAALANGDYGLAKGYWRKLREDHRWYRPAEVGYWSARTLWEMGEREGARFAWNHTASTWPESFHGLASKQAVRRSDGSSQFLIEDMAELAADAPVLEGDDGSARFAWQWLGWWAGDGTAEQAGLADMPGLQQGETLLALGLRQEALAVLNPVPERVRQDPHALLALAEWFAQHELHRLSILSARYLYFLAPSARVAELPIHVQALLFPRPWPDLVASATLSHKVPDLYFWSLLRQESLFEPTAVSGSNAIGLTQVIPDTGDWVALQRGIVGFETAQLERPYLSLDFGAWYLRRVWEDVDRNWLTALVSYNAGPGNGTHFRNVAGADDLEFLAAITLAEPVAYVEAIVVNLYHYTRLYGPVR